MSEQSSEVGSFVLNESVVSRELDDGDTVLLDLRSEQYFSVNSLGGMIWSCLASGDSLDALIETVSRDTESPVESVRSDVDEFIGELTAAGLIRPLS